MANDDFWDDLIKAGLVIGSIFLGVKFLEGLSKKCRKCGNPMALNQTKCNICGEDGQ